MAIRKADVIPPDAFWIDSKAFEIGRLWSMKVTFKLESELIRPSEMR